MILSVVWLDWQRLTNWSSSCLSWDPWYLLVIVIWMPGFGDRINLWWRIIFLSGTMFLMRHLRNMRKRRSYIWWTLYTQIYMTTKWRCYLPISDLLFIFYSLKYLHKIHFSVPVTFVFDKLTNNSFVCTTSLPSRGNQWLNDAQTSTKCPTERENGRLASELTLWGNKEDSICQVEFSSLKEQLNL